MDITVFLGTAIGLLFELFDYQLYGIYVKEITATFFPPSESAKSLTWLVFACGFLCRPLGGVLLGTVADRYGRVRAMQIALICTAFPTTLIGLLPGYDTIGWGSVFGLAVLRGMQGFGIGGEFSSAMVYCIEMSPEHQRCLYGSGMHAAGSVGLLLASLSAAILNVFLSKAQVQDWGWRAVFLMGSPLLLFGMQLRKFLPPSKEFAAFKAQGKEEESLWKSLTRDDAFFVCYIVVIAAWSFAAHYVVMVWAPQEVLGEAQGIYQSLLILFVICLLPCVGKLADIVGSVPQMRAAAFLFPFCAPVLFYLLEVSPSNAGKASCLAVLGGIICLFSSARDPYSIALLTSPSKRTTLFAVANNICACVFAGSGPFIASVLFDRGGAWLVGCYLAVLAVPSYMFVVYMEGFIGKGRAWRYSSIPSNPSVANAVA